MAATVESLLFMSHQDFCSSMNRQARRRWHAIRLLNDVYTERKECSHAGGRLHGPRRVVADRPPPPHSRLQAPRAVSPGLIHPDSWSWKDNWWVIAFACGWLAIGGFLSLGPPEANLERRIQGQVVHLDRDPRSSRLEEYRSEAGRGREEENQQSVLLSPVLLRTMAVQPLCSSRKHDEMAGNGSCPHLTQGARSCLFILQVPM